MDFRISTPPDGGHVGCGIWQRLVPQNHNTSLCGGECCNTATVVKRYFTFFNRANHENICTSKATGKPVNLGDSEGM